MDHFLDLVPTAEEKERIGLADSHRSDIFREASEDEENDGAKAQNVPAGAQAPRQPADDATVGNSVYNETSGLRPTSPDGPGSAQDLSNARIGLARVAKNRDASGTRVGRGTAPGQLVKSEASAVKTYPPAKQAYEDSRAAADKTSADGNGPKGFYLDHGQPKPPWAQGKEPKESYGPFRNDAGGGDAPKAQMFGYEFTIKEPGVKSILTHRRA